MGCVAGVGLVGQGILSKHDFLLQPFQHVMKELGLVWLSHGLQFHIK